MWIRGRRLWGARKPSQPHTHDNWGDGVTVVLHHSADAGPRRNTVRDERRYLQGIQTFHMQARGWADVGYNYAVMPSGRVYELRGFGVRGAHVAEQNTDKCGILLAGTFTTKRPTAKAVASYFKLRRKLRRKGAVIARTVGHGDLMPTTCPGNGVRRAVMS